MPKLSEAVWLAIATAYAYLLAYCFEVGFANHFGYPKSLVPIDLNMVLAAFSIWFLILIVVLILTFILFSIFHINKHHVLVFTAILLLGPSYFLLSLSYLGATKTILYIAAIALSLLFYGFARDMLTRSTHKDFFLLSNLKETIRSFSISGDKEELNTHKILAISLILLGPVGLSISAGETIGQTSRTYFTFSSVEKGYSQDFIVLRMTDKIVIAAPYFPESSEYYQSFIVRNVDDLSIGSLARVRIDNLKKVNLPGKQ